MEFLQPFLSALAAVPDFVPLIILPALLSMAAVLFCLFGGRKGYPVAAIFLGGIAFAMTAAKDISGGFAYMGCFFALAAALSALFFIPVPKREKRVSREERMYEKFHADLAATCPIPPKVEKFSEPQTTAKESGMELGHAEQLLERLKKLPLSPSDRLEVDVLARSLDLYREKPLSEEELSMLNDCLAAALKLTAKYQL